MASIQKIVANFSEADIGDEVILMRLDTGELLSLADTAAAAWRLIDGRKDRAALVAVLKEEYAGDGAEIAADVGRLISDLEEAGLIAQ